MAKRKKEMWKDNKYFSVYEYLKVVLIVYDFTILNSEIITVVKGE